jgi:hypothetical protein
MRVKNLKNCDKKSLGSLEEAVISFLVKKPCYKCLRTSLSLTIHEVGHDKTVSAKY